MEEAEAYMKSLGLRDCRVRYHEGDLARVEVPTSEIGRFAGEEVRTALAAKLKALGFKFVTLDLEGFRSGSLNELVSLDVRRKFG